VLVNEMFDARWECLMSDFHLFDANCQVGRHMRLQAGAPHTTSDLLADMDHFGIAEGLVIDPLSRENHPLDGNARVVEVTAANPRLHPAWAAMPHAPADEQPAGDALLAALREQRVGALFLYPEQYKFTLVDWAVDAFLEPLAAAGVPVFVNYNEVGQPMPWDQTDWDAVVALCRRWPQLPVIVSENRIPRTCASSSAATGCTAASSSSLTTGVQSVWSSAPTGRTTATATR
jgi:hypothetical protein